jgi:hypothetical protein
VVLGVEEAAAVRRHRQCLGGVAADIAVLEAEVERAKQHDQAGPGPEALVHGVAICIGVGDEVGVEAADAEVAGVDGVLDRQQAAVLRVEREDQAQHHI